MEKALYLCSRELISCHGLTECESESLSVMSDSLRPHGIYTVREILQAAVLEWVAIPFSRGSSQPRNQTGVSCTAGRLYTNWASREVPMHGLIMHSINAILQVLIVFCLWPHPTQIHVLPSVLFYVLRGWLWPLSATFSQVSWTTGFLFKSSRYQSIGGECGLYFPCSFSLWTLISGILPWLCNF